MSLHKMEIRLGPRSNLDRPTIIDILSGGDWAYICLINLSNAICSNELHMTRQLGTLGH